MDATLKLKAEQLASEIATQAKTWRQPGSNGSMK
jgi:hypothetical protein